MDDKNDSPDVSATPIDNPQPAEVQNIATLGENGNNSVRQIPGYQILAKIGSGAMAVVFKAKQISLNRIVAIKVLPKSLSADKEYVARFYQEGQAAAKLNHANIVQAFDVGEAHGYHYFVMEYVKGKTVYEELEAGKIYTEAECLHIAIQMAEALEHAHSVGLIHRDVKPKNIMITSEGVAKLMDMGLARVVNDPEAIAAEAGRLFGTPYYISPEQIMGKSNVDFRCDIYSLGATMYHMLTGRVPFDGEDSKAVMIKHVKQKLPPPDRYNLDLSFGICKLILKMMAKDPSRRHASTKELLDDMRSIEFLLEVENPREQDSPMPDLQQHMEKVIPPRPAVEQVTPPTKPAESVEWPQFRRKPNWPLWIGLAVSVLLNIILLILYLASR